LFVGQKTFSPGLESIYRCGTTVSTRYLRC
jgi:hypothetical protein